MKKYPSLRRELNSLSESVYESEDAFLYSPSPDKLKTLVEKLNESKISFSIVSPSQLHTEGK